MNKLIIFTLILPFVCGELTTYIFNKNKNVYLSNYDMMTPQIMGPVDYAMCYPYEEMNLMNDLYFSNSVCYTDSMTRISYRTIIICDDINYTNCFLVMKKLSWMEWLMSFLN